MKEFFVNVKQSFKGMTPNEAVLLILTFSIFLTVYAEIAALILLPVYIFATKQGSVFFKRKDDLIFLSAFWALSFAVTLLNGGKTFDILICIGMIFAFIAMIFITYTMTQRCFRLILSMCCVMSVPAFIVACIQKFMIGGGRYSSVFENPNYYAFFISMVILFCIYNILKPEHIMPKWVYALLIPLNLVALYLTECRTTIAVLVIVCPIMLGFLKNKKWLIIYVSAAAVALLCMLLFGGKLLFIPRIDNFFQDISLRIGIWKGAIKSILDAPLFGRGYNTYVRINNLYGSFDAAHSHNLLLELLMDFGIAGTLIISGYFAINIGKIIRLHKKNICHMRYALTISVIVSVLLHGLLDITMLWPQTSLLVMYVIGFSTEYDKVRIFGNDRKHKIISHEEK